MISMYQDLVENYKCSCTKTSWSMFSLILPGLASARNSSMCDVNLLIESGYISSKLRTVNHSQTVPQLANTREENYKDILNHLLLHIQTNTMVLSNRGRRRIHLLHRDTQVKRDDTTTFNFCPVFSKDAFEFKAPVDIPKQQDQICEPCQKESNGDGAMDVDEKSQEEKENVDLLELAKSSNIPRYFNYTFRLLTATINY